MIGEVAPIVNTRQIDGTTRYAIGHIKTASVGLVLFWRALPNASRLVTGFGLKLCFRDFVDFRDLDPILPLFGAELIEQFDDCLDAGVHRIKGVGKAFIIDQRGFGTIVQLHSIIAWSVAHCSSENKDATAGCSTRYRPIDMIRPHRSIKSARNGA